MAGDTPRHAPLSDLRRWADYESREHSSKDISDEQLLELAGNDYVCHVVPHTHWDKEWGFCFEQHHLRLVKLLDNTIDILENDPEYRCFVLDGQSSLVSDYLYTRPEMRERIEVLVKAGRLLLGPWFTQLDMFVSSGEEIVRNLQIGIRTAREVGGEMRWGHSADNFGYCAQLPQIYNGFGIDRASFYRGPDPGGEEYKTVFEWHGLDNSAVTVANFTGGAGYLMFTWPFNVPEMAEHFVIKTLHRVATCAVTNKLLFPAGTDAAEPDREMPAVLKKLEKSFPGFTFKISSFSEYMDDVLADKPEIPTFKGTLRHPARSCVGCITGRLNLKRDNAEFYTNIEHFAEPFCSLAWFVAGRRYPASSFDHAWKEVFENLSHDDMAGFSYDPVYYIGKARYFENNRMCEMLAIRGMKTLIENIKTPDKTGDANRSLVVFNPLPWTRTDLVDTNVPLQPQSGIPSKFLDGEYTSFRVVDMDGNEMPATVSGGCRVQFVAKDVPSFGYKTFRLMAEKTPVHVSEPKDDVRTLENEYIRLSFRDDGRFDMLDKETGREYPGLHYFEDQNTPGSALGFTWQGEPISTIGHEAKMTLVEDGPACRTMRVAWKGWMIPSNRGDDKEIELPITSYVTLAAGKKRADIYTEVENNAYYHFLRAAFPVNVKVDTFAMGEQFGAQDVPVWNPENPPEKAWTEQIYPHHDWLDVSDGTTGLAVLDRGTPVVSVYPAEEGVRIMLPMFRSCGSNGGDARHSIPGNRLASRDVPGAQLIGTQRISYSIMPHTGDWRSAKIYQEGPGAAVRLWPEELHQGDRQKWQLGVYGFDAVYEQPEGTMPTEQSFLSVEPDGVQMSAFKKAETGDSLIARLYNTLPEEQTVKATFFRSVKNVRAVNMMEDEEVTGTDVTWNATDAGTTEISFTLRPFQIITLALDVDAPEIGLWPHTTY